MGGRAIRPSVNDPLGNRWEKSAGLVADRFLSWPRHLRQLGYCANSPLGDGPDSRDRAAGRTEGRADKPVTRANLII